MASSAAGEHQGVVEILATRPRELDCGRHGGRDDAAQADARQEAEQAEQFGGRRGGCREHQDGEKGHGADQHPAPPDQIREIPHHQRTQRHAEQRQAIHRTGFGGRQSPFLVGEDGVDDRPVDHQVITIEHQGQEGQGDDQPHGFLLDRRARPPCRGAGTQGRQAHDVRSISMT